MKMEKTGRLIVGVLVVLGVCGVAMGAWSTPVLVSELNGPTGELAAHPCLSRDGLTMYFARCEPGGSYLRIVEAYRDTPQGIFTSEDVQDELVSTGYDLKTPWISSDGLRLYYEEFEAAGTAKAKMAQRASTGDTWTVVRLFDELHVGGADVIRPSLTEDELIVTFASTRPGGSGKYDLWMASRTSIDATFGNIRPLYEINSFDWDQWPCIMPDGLTLYFTSIYRDGDEIQLYRATRSSLITTFNNVERVNIPVPSPEVLPYISYVTPDEKTVYFTAAGRNIYVSHWVEISGVFHVDAVNGDNSNDGLTKESAFATIQYAIDISADGSTVLVWPGSYNEQVDFKGRAITVQSAAEAAEVHTSTGYAFSFHTGEGPDSVLKNIVIRDSEYGIYLINGSSPTISNLTIVNNEFGISAFDGSNPDISNCILWGNTYGDMEGCEATYSCVQDGSAGEGNIDTYPLFGDMAAGDYHLKSERGRFVPVDPTLPPWTAPVHLAELDDGANKASYFCLSADGLTIYFERYIPSLGHACVVEAHRNFTEEPFGEQRVVDELANGFDVKNPWISSDELRLYYREKDATGFPRIKMAERVIAGGAWAYAKTFDELHVDDAIAVGQSLTGDELEIFFQSNRPGGSGGFDLWMATRTSTEEPFGNIRPLYELNSPEGDVGPYIMPDGLTLYFISFRDDSNKQGIYKATRSATNETFGEPLRIVLTDDETNYYYSVCVVADESTIYYYRNNPNSVYVTQFFEGQWLLDGDTSLCIDAAGPDLNPSGEPMPNGGRVNMGAYGGTASASMSEWPIEGDINRNGIVNIGDLAILSRDWLSSLPWFVE